MGTPNKKGAPSDPTISEEEILKQEEISYKMVESRIKYIQGKILTLLESAVTNDRQLDSLKSLTKSIFSENLTQFHNNVFPNCKLITEGDMCDYSSSVEKFYEENEE